MRARLFALAMVLGLVALAVSPRAQANDGYGIEIRIISAQPGAEAIDPALQGYASDLRAMPYKQFKLVDQQVKSLKKGETVSMQFPGPGQRFLKVKANGTKDGKHSFALAIDAINFKTSVRIPENGTLIVGGPKHEAGVILIAVTARAVAEQ